ncbi:uncharacterized protein Tco025E_08233 [Trypanosoma conorhini]|uniref:RRM domain-containing protein n=1 Tax=Trypanosoma conorhini TaxID=83891 RepID=A0A422NCF4_9TRYP|nr:uncharacterized protein Tco025E_08233 [Trypanosoma conorhini]RNF03190.1 hypothetical protein Tco025E_08233 [Trypanosoma conorhini]
MHSATSPAVRLNPYARDWAPAAAAGPPGSAAADATEIPLLSWFQRAWMEVRQSYYNYCYYWYMYHYGRCEAERERHNAYMTPLTMAAFCEAPSPREVATGPGAPAAGTDASVQNPPCIELAPLHGTKEQHSLPPSFPHPNLFLGNNMADGKRIETCHCSPSAVSSCLLCGKDDHLYTACRLFDGKTVCFINTSDFTVYAMRHDHWIERATLRDIAAFVRLAMGLTSPQAFLQVGSQQLTLEDYPSGTRCCDLQILPGVVVGVSRRQASPGTNTAPSQRPDGRRTAKRERGSQEVASDEDAAAVEEALDASTIAWASELSVSLPLLERHPGARDDAATESLTGGTVCVGEHENTPVSNGGGTALPSPATPREGASDLETASVNAAAPVSTAPGPAVVKPPSFHSSSKDSFGASERRIDWAAVVRKGGHCREPPVADATAELPATQQFAETELAQATLPTAPGTLAAVAEAPDAEALRLRRTLHVRFLPVQMSFREIRKLLWSCGEVSKVRLVKPRATTNPGRMFYVCFVEYATDEGARKVKELHGRHVADSFRLAVECSRNPILGGYVTDRDAHTGRPCTFGLSESERLAVERRYADVRGGGSEAARRDTGEVSDGGAKKSSRRRGGQRRRAKESPKAPVSITSTPSSVGAGDERDSAAVRDKEDGIGPYALQIVAKDDHSRRLRQGASLRRADAVTGGGGGDNDEAPAALAAHTALRTRAAAAALPPVVGRDVGGSCEQALRERLCAATSCYVQHTTPRNLFDVLSVLEEAKWCSVTVMFRLFLARCEVALFLHYVLPRALENATVAATQAVQLGNSLTRLLTDVGANGERSALMWGALFTSVPPSRQPFRVPRDDAENGDEPLGSGRDIGCYPSFEKVLHFVELLLHITLLFADFQCKNRREHAGSGVDCAAPPTTTSAGVGSGGYIAEKLLACARRLLVQLQTGLVGEEVLDASAEVHVWRSKVSCVLRLLPPEPGWSAGSLLDALLPGRTQLAAAVLATQTELSLF